MAKRREKRGKKEELGDEQKKLISDFEKLYYEKPLGYFAYIATCMSAMPFSVPSETDKRTKKAR